MSQAAPPHSVDDYRQGYESEHRIRGFRCPCGFVTVTWVLACPNCGRESPPESDLGTEGRIAAFSVQTVPSDEFLNDAPYAYVLVDLDGGGRVAGWIPAIRAESDLSIGQKVRFIAGYKPGLQFEVVTE